MLHRIASNWRVIFTMTVLIGLAALALVRGVSVLAEDRGSAGGQPRQTVPAPAMAPTEAVRSAPAGQTQAAASAGAQAIAPTPQAPGTITYHTVQTGETLGKIALKYGLTTTAIASANGISNADLIRVGQRLIIPAH